MVLFSRIINTLFIQLFPNILQC